MTSHRLSVYLRRQPIHLARVVGRHRRAGVTGKGLGSFDTELVADAGGDVVTEPAGRPAWDAERLTGTRDSGLA